ncbi:gag-protease polyprotein [Tanacetum coccineum]
MFVDLTHDDSKTPSPKHQLSSPSAPNAPSKTPSTKGTSSSSIDYTPKSPTSSTSPSTNGYLNSLTSPPPRVPPPPPTQENTSMDITLTISPITPLYVQFNTPSPSLSIFSHPIPWNLLEAHEETYGKHNADVKYERADGGVNKPWFLRYMMAVESCSVGTNDPMGIGLLLLQVCYRPKQQENVNLHYAMSMTSVMRLGFRILIGPLNKVENSDFVLPKYAMDNVKSRYENSLVGYFIGEVTKVPVWVKLDGVPVLAYSDDGLSLIATQIGNPIMLDAFTSTMCVES